MHPNNYPDISNILIISFQKGAFTIYILLISEIVTCWVRHMKLDKDHVCEVKLIFGSYVWDFKGSDMQNVHIFGLLKVNTFEPSISIGGSRFFRFRIRFCRKVPMSEVGAPNGSAPHRINHRMLIEN